MTRLALGIADALEFLGISASRVQTSAGRQAKDIRR
jgi:hypothetical protein